MAPLKLYWSSGLKNGRKNFGDWLSPLLVQTLSGREVIHVPPNDCDLVAVGSILHRVKHHWWNRRVHIWGSGFIEAGHPLTPRHHYHAVRGAQSAALLPGARIETLGDPGLLAHRALPTHRDITKRTRIALIPHYKDQRNEAIAAFLERMPGSRMLDILSEPEDFLPEIAACQFVLSSSLHGLIVADAFGIPNAWIELSGAVRGAQFKFRDYYSVFGIVPAPQRLEMLSDENIENLRVYYERPGLEQIQQRLEEAFPFPR